MYIKDDIMENFIKREAIENNIQKLAKSRQNADFVTFI